MIDLVTGIKPEQRLCNRPDIEKEIKKVAQLVIGNLHVSEYDECNDLFDDYLSADIRNIGLGLESIYHAEVDEKRNRKKRELRHSTAINPN
ncbi:MAG: hypothetical protein Kapaf2KO_22660 [Candidatus Kapaibacteriales bacterium]